MITLTHVYWLLGAYFLATAWRGLRDAGNPRRHTTALFWGLLAGLLFAAERLSPAVVGALVVALALLAGLGGLRMGRYEESSAREKQAEAARLGNRLFGPALLIPAVTLVLAVEIAGFSLSGLAIAGYRLLDAKQTTVIALAVACVVALGAACRLTRQTPWSAVEQSRRLIDAIGWAALLPLLLATLGSVFEAGGVGQAVAGVVRGVIPVQNAFVVVLAYAVGMALFTIVMGNAFAAFPVMTAGIGLPLLIQQHGAEPAILGALGMLTGYFGTLMTPMAANFNIVPAALLELKDRNGVVKAQIGTALPLLACNIALIYWLAFP